MKNGETICKREIRDSANKETKKQPQQKLFWDLKKKEKKKQDLATFMQDDEATTAAECVVEPCGCQLQLWKKMWPHLKFHFLYKDNNHGKIAYCDIIPAN